MKRNGTLAGFFVFLAVGFVFPSLHSGHEHGAVATVHQHSHGESLALGGHSHGDAVLAGEAASHEHGDHHTTPRPCNDDCCAPSCFAMPVVAGLDSYPGYFASGPFMRPQDRHLKGFTPLTAERPPRA